MTRKAKQPKLNKELFKEILRAISRVPARFDMDIIHRDTHGDNFAGPENPACNTQACIAGWALLLDAGNKKTWPKVIAHYAALTDDEWAVDARKLLGITEDEAAALFYWGGTWGAGSPGTKEHVEEAKRRINLLLTDREEFAAQYF